MIVIPGANQVSLILHRHALSLRLTILTRLRHLGHSNILLLLIDLEFQRVLVGLDVGTSAWGCSVIFFACSTAFLGQDWGSMTRMTQTPKVL